MKKRQKAVIFGTLIAGAILSSCATGARDEAKVADQEILDTRTVLDVARPHVSEVEARLLVGQGGNQLTQVEALQLRDFTNDFMRLGRGNIVVSYPIGSPNEAAAQALVREIQMRLYSEGVEVSKMGFGPYSASNQSQAPVVIAFNRFEVAPVACKSWSEIDPRKTANNMATERFGCSQSANLAAMIVDPGDLIGDRQHEPTDAARAQVAVDAFRKGELKQVSGAVSGGTN